MTRSEVKLAGRLLRLAAAEFSNHGCNDMDLRLVADFPQHERAVMAAWWNAWNGSQDEPREFEQIYDSQWMHYLADQLEGSDIGL